MATFKDLTPPKGGTITIAGRRPPGPRRSRSFPFVEGDGTGRDIWRASRARLRRRRREVLRRQAARSPGSRCWPARRPSTRPGSGCRPTTLTAFREYLVGIKGPLTTPVGGGIRSLNVALRQELDLYVCLRPVRYFKGVPSPVKRPEDVDMVIFRENTEDIYAGIEWAAEHARGEEGHRLAPDGDEGQEDPLPGDERHRHQARLARGHRAAGARRHPLRARLRAQERHPRPQGQHHEVHRGRLPRLGLRARHAGSSATQVVTERESWILGNKEKNAGHHRRGQRARDRARLRPDDRRAARRRCARRSRPAWRSCPTHGDGKWKSKLLVRDSIADITLQQVLTRPKEFDVIATLEPERRLPLRRAGRAGGRHRHRARRQHQLRDRPRHLRGHPRHGARSTPTSTR